jgi:hypothetical protein
MSLHDARKELRYLLNRGYKKKTALDFVANHYGINRDDRNILARTTYSDEECEATVSKLATIASIRGAVLAVDGYNVLNTTESVLFDDPLVCDDGVIRDDLKRSGTYDITERTDAVLGSLNDFFSRARPEKAIFLFDQAVSHSGEHAAYVRNWKWKVPVETRTVPDVDYELRHAKDMLVATGDSGIIAYVASYVDIPRYLLFAW